MLDHFEGVVDSVEDIGEGKVSTSIIVNVQDQAQLCGIINILYDHRLVLISVIWDHLLLERKSGAITKSLLKGTQDVFFQKLGTSLNAKTN
jgi:hypothetical protein